MVTPLAVTLWVLFMLMEILSGSNFTRWLTSPFFTHSPDQKLSLFPTLLSLMMVLVILFSIGVIFRNILGRRLYSLIDTIMEKTPVLNRIYTFVRAVSESILSQKETMFKEVVLIEYPHPGSQAIAFVSAIVPKKIQGATKHPEEPHLFVFLPTTPNPTSGFLLALPRSKVTPLDLSTTEAMRLIISAGASGPDEHDSLSPAPSLIDKLDHMMLKQRKKMGAPADLYQNLNYPDDEG